MSLDVARLQIEADSTQVRSASRDLKELEVQSGKTEKSAKGMASTMKTVGAIIASSFATYQIQKFVKEATLAYARFETLGVVMKQVGQNAGYSADEMAQFEMQLRKHGIAMTESRLTLTKMVQAQIDLADSAKLARLAQDAAVIGNLNSSEAFSKLIHGIQTVQTETLRTIGINVRFEDGYKKLAKQLGKTADDLTEVEKTQARVNLVMEAGTRITGVYEAAMETAGKKFGSMTRHIDDLMVVVGKTFDQTFVKGIDAVTEILKSTRAWVEENDKLLQMGFEEGLARIVDVLKVLVVLIGTRLVASLITSTATLGFHIQQWVAYQWQLAKFIGVSRTAASAQLALTGAVKAGNTALALVGGPAGAAVIAAYGIVHFREELGLVKPNADKATEAVDKLTKGIEKLNEVQAASRKLHVLNELDKQTANLKKFTDEIEHWQKVLKENSTEDLGSEAIQEIENKIIHLKSGAIEFEKIIEKLKSSLDLLEIVPTAKNDAENLRRVASAMDHARGKIPPFKKETKELSEEAKKAAEQLKEVKKAIDELGLSAALGMFETYDFSKVADDRVVAELQAAETSAQIWKEKHEKAYALQKRLSQVSYDELADLDRRRIEQAKNEEEQARQEKIRKEKEASEKIKKEWERVYDDMHKFAADTFYDIFDGQLDSFEDFTDQMLNIFKRMLANMAAEAAMTNIFKPMMNQMAGSTLGNMLGLPSLAGGGGTTMFPSFGGMSNLPGMGWLGATIPGSTNLAMTTAGASQGMLYPGAISGPAPAGFGGVTWGSALGAGALGSLGYSTLGSAIGLPTSGYSGITSGLGAAGMSAYGGSLASLTGIGALGGPIGIGLGALAGGLLGGLFGGSDPTPTIQLKSGLRPDSGVYPGEVNSPAGFNYHTWLQDVGSRAEIGSAVTGYFDSLFIALDNVTKFSVKDVLSSTSFLTRVDPNDYDGDMNAILAAMSRDIFGDIQENLEIALLGFDSSSIDLDFFEAIKVEGESLFNTFARFSSVLENTDNFIEEFTRRTEELGLSAETAYQQIQLISGVMSEMDMAIAQITGSAVIGQINALSDTWNAYIDVMKQAQASAEQLVAAEQKKNLVVGSQVTGLNINSIAQAIKSGSSVDAIVSKAMGDLVAEKMAQEMFDEMVPVVEEAGRIWSETGGNIDAVTDYLRSMGYQFEDTMSVFSDSMESARDALDAAIGKEEQLINARLDAAVKIDTLLVDLMGGSQAPVQSMEFFERRYEQLLAEAQGATTAEEINSSVDALTGFVSQYLDFAGDYGGQDYNSLFNKITSDLKDIEYEQRSEAEKQISKLEEINSTLGIVADAALSLETAFADFLSAQSDFLSAQSEVGQAGFNEAKYMQNKVDQLNQIGFEGKSWDLESTYAAFDRVGLTPLEHYLRYGKDEGLMPFADGGISTGPSSGYPIMAHNTEAHVPIKNGSIPVEISGPGTIPNVNLKIFIGNKEIKDFQVEVINTDPEAQRAIRRVANG
jgi:hypothetical protein